MDRPSLKVHFYSAHRKNSFKCPICGIAKSYKRSLKTHMTEEHKIDLPDGLEVMEAFNQNPDEQFEMGPLQITEEIHIKQEPPE